MTAGLADPLLQICIVPGCSTAFDRLRWVDKDGQHLSLCEKHACDPLFRLCSAPRCRREARHLTVDGPLCEIHFCGLEE